MPTPPACMPFSLALASLALAPGALAPPTGASPLADSVAGFSGVQGQDGWFYGAYRGTLTSASFTPMGSFSGTNWWGEPGAGGVWTCVWATGQRGNGAYATGGRRGEQQWAVRRWVSDHAGPARVRISARMATPHCLSPGATARVYVDGAQAWSAHVAGRDGEGVHAELLVTLAVGSTVDFIADPDPTFTPFDALDLRAVIEPGCPGDADGDGDLDVADLLAFLSRFRAGDADWNADGGTDVRDLLAFLGAFRQGC